MFVHVAAFFRSDVSFDTTDLAVFTLSARQVGHDSPKRLADVSERIAGNAGKIELRTHHASLGLVRLRDL